MEKEKKFIKGLLLGNENLVLQIFFFSSVKSKIKHNFFFFLIKMKYLVNICFYKNQNFLNEIFERD